MLLRPNHNFVPISGYMLVFYLNSVRRQHRVLTLLVSHDFKIVRVVLTAKTWTGQKYARKVPYPRPTPNSFCPSCLDQQHPRVARFNEPVHSCTICGDVENYWKFQMQLSVINSFNLLVRCSCSFQFSVLYIEIHRQGFWHTWIGTLDWQGFWHT